MGASMVTLRTLASSMSKSGPTEASTSAKAPTIPPTNTPTKQKGKCRNRKRKIIWYNPPYHSNVSTNIGKKFFSLIKKHFPSTNKYSKIFNKNTVKLSYSCMPNMASIIKQNNGKILNQRTKEKDEERCNCRKQSDCPLDGKCQQTSVIYEATIKTNGNSFKYIGLTEGTFKKRFYSHRASFCNEKQQTATELSKKVWELKSRNESYTITWKILDRPQPYKIGSTSCDLCITEKLYILKGQSHKLLNSRNELISKCRHLNKFLLKNVS